MFQTYFRFKLRVKLNPTSILEDSQDRSTKIVSYIQHMDLSLLSGALLGVVDVLPEESAWYGKRVASDYTLEHIQESRTVVI